MKYSLSPREIPRAKPKGFPEGSGHNTDIFNYKYSIDLPGISILEELILRTASTAGLYKKILPSRLG